MELTVDTSHGTVRGKPVDAHLSFRGIPFAAPPVGALRFAAPQPAASWTGVRDAYDYSASAHQPQSPLPGMTVGAQSEDCLYLNVFTPATDEAKRPVMVWIHGGGFTTGGACQDLYRGGPLVERGDIVLVTINYRLGILGYLDLPELEGATANAGQLDQIAALEWVRDNIERFGGDPANVTIFGESAGGMAVSTLLAMPRAKGLFHKAIAQSGAANVALDREVAGQIADRWLDRIGLGRETVSQLRDKPAEDLIAAQLAATGDFRETPIFLPAAPVVDGDTLPEHPLDAIRAGASRDVSLIAGTTLDEWRLFEMPSLLKDFDRAVITRRFTRLLPAGTNVDALVDAYAEARGEDPNDREQAKTLYCAIQTDRIFRVPVVRLAETHANEGAPTWMYLFTWPSPARRGELGACHAIEIPFVFGTLDARGMDRFSGTGPEADRLAERMMDAWIAFARNGEPNHAGLPSWAPFDSQQRATMQFDAQPALVEAPMELERRAWDSI